MDWQINSDHEYKHVIQGRSIDSIHIGVCSKSGVLTCTFTIMAEHPDTITITWQPPPAELFDAQIDVAATLATNSALLRNAPLARHFTRRCLQYAGTRMRAGNRIAIGHVARFIEAELHDVDVLDGEGVEREWRAGAAIEAEQKSVTSAGGGPVLGRRAQLAGRVGHGWVQTAEKRGNMGKKGRRPKGHE